MMTNIYRIFFPLLIAGLTACHQKREETRPQERDLTEAVYASGTLVPENEYKVMPSMEGFLQQSLVKEGDTIKKGQVLFSLSNDDRQAQVTTSSRLVVRTLPVVAPDAPSIKDLENRLAAARAALENDSLQYSRYRVLYEQTAISAANYEKYRLQYETSRYNVKSLEDQVRQQVLASALQLQQADNALQLARTSRANGLLKSYTDGIVYDIYKKTGDLVSSTQPIALVGSGRMIARLLVDEDDLGKLRSGQKVLITMDAYPGRIFHAQVEKIYPLLDKQEQSFRVDAIFDEEMPVKIYGLNIEANIVVAEQEKALVIPKKALLKGDSVLVKDGDRIVRVKIRKGVEDNDYVQVLDGLTPSSTIIIGQ
jgi:HlyD family secretion protein